MDTGRREFFGHGAAMLGTAVLAANLSGCANSGNVLPAGSGNAALLDCVGPGKKFDFDGQALRYRGNSMICHLPQDKPFYQAVVALQERIKKSRVGDLNIWLPKCSLHVTVFNGTNETMTQRKPGFWPADLPLEASIEDVHAHYLNKLKGFRTGLPSPFRMRVSGFYLPVDKAGVLSSFELTGVTLGVEPADAETKSRLEDMRRRLGELLQTTRNPVKKDDYHISLAYPWKKHSTETAKLGEMEIKQWAKELQDAHPVFELAEVEFALFNDMLSYSPLLKMKP